MESLPGPSLRQIRYRHANSEQLRFYMDAPDQIGPACSRRYPQIARMLRSKSWCMPARNMVMLGSYRCDMCNRRKCNVRLSTGIKRGYQPQHSYLSQPQLPQRNKIPYLPQPQLQPQPQHSGGGAVAVAVAMALAVAVAVVEAVAMAAAGCLYLVLRT